MGLILQCGGRGIVISVGDLDALGKRNESGKLEFDVRVVI